MDVSQIMARLESLGNDSTRKTNLRNGCGENQFGVKMGDLRVLAKDIRVDHDLGLQLWRTGNWDARLLATQIMKPKSLSAENLDSMVIEISFAPNTMTSQLCDWFMKNLVKLHPDKEKLRIKWLASEHPMAARAGWSLTAERVVKEPEGLDLAAILDRIEKEMPSAPTPVQWTMNFALGEIGIRFPEFRQRAIAIGEKIGAFRDYPTPKGCTSPYAPIWIAAMVARKG